MSFVMALTLVRQLEGGKVVDAGGPTNQGMTQRTWEGFGMPGSVFNATDGQIATCYRKLWDSLKIRDEVSGSLRSLFELMPEPVDSIAFQFFINIRPEAFVKSFQAALLVRPDGIIATKSLISLRLSTRTELMRGVMTAQVLHYACHADPAILPGLMNRVEKARLWAEKTF